MRPRQFLNMCISCKNNGLLRHWLDLRNSCLLDILKMASLVALADTSEMSFRYLFKVPNQRFC